ncbi:MAG: hypothetical protein L6R38_008709 [Xanthoria sp. 2 TBL-2021]|nr:MAG: hypothetical protein L6R38_008709 [Xanthoria sp. 2 TBL-2021]
MADNLVEMDVVTADGSEITVSEASNPDLYWGMRGAGQNFGIVTKFIYKIFDYPNGQDIFHATYHFTEDQLEILFEHLNRLLDNGTLPKDVNAYVVLRYGRKARELFLEGARPMRFHAYSNYANGDETLEQLYGYESWRLEKLRRLKRKWDPNGSFRFFNPITDY